MAKTSKQSGADLKIQAMTGEEESATLARTALRPSINAAVTIKEYSRKYGELDLTSLVNELSGLAKLANEGDLGRAEAMLMIQAHTLDAIFNNLAQRSALNLTVSIKVWHYAWVFIGRMNNHGQALRI